MNRFLPSVRLFLLGSLFVTAWFTRDVVVADEVGRGSGGSLVGGFPAPVNGCRFQNRSTYDKWWANREVLGNPISNEQASTRSSSGAFGTFMLFERGTIMRIANGRHAGRTCVVRGGIASKYSDFGGPAGELGFPIFDEQPLNAAGHDRQKFESGFIEWSKAAGDFVVQVF